MVVTSQKRIQNAVDRIKHEQNQPSCSVLLFFILSTVYCILYSTLSSKIISIFQQRNIFPGGFCMKIKHIDHIGIAVKSIEQAGKFYTDVLGLKIMDIENVAEQKVNVAFLPITDSEVELLQSTHDDGPLAKFIEAKGEGIQHIAYRVENIEEALRELKSKGIRLIDEKPRKGAGGAKIAFIHPKETNGVLVEICERK